MTDPHIAAWLDQEDAEVSRMIRECGWYIQFVMGDERKRKTSIAYTIGMFGLGHPELVALGLDPGSAAAPMRLRFRHFS
ncbi:MAG TPA: DUF4262 domain-containing protein [Acidothermaceae bacterium]|jgi:hypothetical protein